MLGGGVFQPPLVMTHNFKLVAEQCGLVLRIKPQPQLRCNVIMEQLTTSGRKETRLWLRCEGDKEFIPGIFRLLKM